MEKTMGKIDSNKKQKREAFICTLRINMISGTS